MKKNKGFSLIELSIVLTIITLIITGIIIGNRLVKIAQGQKVVRSVIECDQAIRFFRERFNCLPGDCTNGATYGFSKSGNGNGIIDDSPSYESSRTMWNQITDSGLYNQFSSRSPSINNGHYFGSKGSNDSTIIWAENGPNIVDGTMFSSGFGTLPESKMQVADMFDTKLYGSSGRSYYGLSAKKSYFLDKKIDDGVASSGYITTIVSPVSNVTNAASCGSNATYDISTNSDCFTFYDFPSLKY